VACGHPGRPLRAKPKACIRPTASWRQVGTKKQARAVEQRNMFLFGANTKRVEWGE
jgi:hypothetical protein